MTATHTTDGTLTTSARRRPGYGGEVWVGVACLAGGVALGALWVLVRAVVLDGTDGQEQAAASDGVFCLLGLLFGVVSALLLATLPGHHQVVRAGVALGGSTVGGYLGLAVGLLLGATSLRADGLVLAWPVALGTLTTLRLLVVHLLGRE